MRLRTPAFGQQKMNTYLITWNPKVWPWVTLEDKRQGQHNMKSEDVPLMPPLMSPQDGRKRRQPKYAIDKVVIRMEGT